MPFAGSPIVTPSGYTLGNVGIPNRARRARICCRANAPQAPCVNVTNEAAAPARARRRERRSAPRSAYDSDHGQRKYDQASPQETNSHGFLLGGCGADCPSRPLGTQRHRSAAMGRLCDQRAGRVSHFHRCCQCTNAHLRQQFAAAVVTPSPPPPPDRTRELRQGERTRRRGRPHGTRGPCRYRSTFARVAR